jgi:signal transduction histidine kinase
MSALGRAGPARAGVLPLARSTAGPWVPAGLAAVLVAGGFALGLHLSNLHNGLIASTFTAVGTVVLAARPGHREGALFLATGIAHAVMFAGRQYGLATDAAGGTLPGARWVLWAAVWPLALVLVLAGVTLMCFPDGHLPSPRWRFAVAVMVVAGAVVSLMSALWPVEYADNSLSLSHPLDLPGYPAAQRVWNVLGPASYLAFQLAWVAGVLVRVRRADGDEARRLRWFVSAVTLTAAVMVVGVLTVRSPLPGVLSVPFVAVAAGVAILRYRVDDIDVVISRTLVVGAMAAVITAGYVAVVAGAGSLVGSSTEAAPVLPLVATALVAVAFEPARRRVQAWADRVVHGRRPSPYESLARLSTQLSDGGDVDLFTGLASTVADGVGAARVTLRVGTDDEPVVVATWPPTHADAASPADPACPDAGPAAGGHTHVRPIVHRGEVRGAVTVTKARGEALTAAEDRLLGDLLAQAGIVIEVHATARRIVAAQDEARRLIERDLHDGAQQRLVTVALGLHQIAERVAATGDADLAGRVESARRELSQALAELREMARGIHPTVLTENGLEVALGALAERAPLPVRLDVRLDRRFARDVEATAYFVVSEALTNAAKHAGASRVAVSGGVRDGRLWVEVADDGRGGAEGRFGSGLQGLADRLATASGRLVVDSPAGGGTRLRAELPCG